MVRLASAVFVALALLPVQLCSNSCATADDLLSDGTSLVQVTTQVMQRGLENKPVHSRRDSLGLLDSKHEYSEWSDAEASSAFAHRVAPLVMIFSVCAVVAGALFIYQKEVDKKKDCGKCEPIAWYIEYQLSVTVCSLVLFFLLASCVLTYLEDWRFVTSMYVSAEILTTVGYGDVVSRNAHTRWFMTWYVLVVVVFVASLVQDVATIVVDKNQDVLRKSMRNIHKRYTEDKIAADSRRNTRTASAGQDETSPEEQKAASPISDEDFMNKYHLNRLFASFILFFAACIIGALFYSVYESCTCSYGVTREDKYPDCFDSGPNENCAEKGSTKSFARSFYMAVVTLTTVGFGDFTPQTRFGRMFAIPWMIIGLCTSGNMIASIAITKHAFIKAKRREARTTESLMTAAGMSPDKDELTHVEFLKYMLLKNEMVKSEDLDNIDEIFHAHDPAHTGKISLGDANQEG